uniref:Uncharacterized protein n=1 Tax=Anguilla anguilla TaxID=7936 RepID=A0A0E9VCR7_ANGAN
MAHQISFSSESRIPKVTCN